MTPEGEASLAHLLGEVARSAGGGAPTWANVRPIPYRRPPRSLPEAPREEEVRIAAPPTLDPPAQGGAGAAIYLLPALAGCGSIAFFFAGSGGPNRWLGAAAAGAVVLSALSAVLVWWTQRRGSAKRRRRARTRYLAYLDRVEQELAEVAAAQQARLTHGHPETSGLTELVAVR